MNRVNIFNEVITPDFFFTSFIPDRKQEYEFYIYDFNSAEEKFYATDRKGEKKYYLIWSAKALKDYTEHTGIPEDVAVKLHFPKSSFYNALGKYFAGRISEWNSYKKSYEDRLCNVVLHFKRVTQKEIVITHIRVLEKGM